MVIITLVLLLLCCPSDCTHCPNIWIKFVFVCSFCPRLTLFHGIITAMKQEIDPYFQHISLQIIHYVYKIILFISEVKLQKCCCCFVYSWRGELCMHRNPLTVLDYMRSVAEFCFRGDFHLEL